MVDFSLDNKSILKTDDVDLIIQQIDMLFDTKTDDVFGEKYGSWFEEFLYDLNVSNEYINSYTKRLIEENVNLMGFEVEVNTQLMLGTEHDIMLIQIELRRDLESYAKTYKLD